MIIKEFDYDLKISLTLKPNAKETDLVLVELASVSIFIV
jgi:hypothetical protein